MELYDLETDPLEMSNLAGRPGSEAHIKRLRSKLETWMTEQGDKGVETELKARERQGGGRKKNNPKKK